MKISESLARRFTPAGFEQPEGSRQNYVKPRPELQEAFYKWVGEIPEAYVDLSAENQYVEGRYQRALDILDVFGEIPCNEANSLLVNFRPKARNHRMVGLFVSACYTHSPEQFIIFDVDSEETGYIGHILAKDKVLVNNGEAGDWFAYKSSGFIVNNGKMWNSAWACSSGTFINNGLTGWGLGQGSIGYPCLGTFFDLKNIVNLCIPRMDVYKFSDLLMRANWEKIPELKEYIEELKEITKAIKDERSAKRFFERYGPEPKERIQEEIKSLLEGR